MHFKLALFLLVPMAMGFPAAISIPVETLTVTNIIPAAVYDLKAWQAVVDEHLANPTLEARDLEARSNVPGLHCGLKRFLNCAESEASAIVSCGWAVYYKGLDTKEDSKCAAAITSAVANPSTNCNLCILGHA